MRILFLSKRHYMGHDVIVDRYARLYEYPYHLAEANNQVLGLCLSYYKCEPIDTVHSTNGGYLRWVGLSAGTFRSNILTYPIKILSIARVFKPDLIVGSSDCLHIVLAHWLSQKLNVRLSVDLYDDFETFALSKRIPFLRRLYRKAIKQSNLVSCVSNTLTERVRAICGKNNSVITLPSTIDKRIFRPSSKHESREFFGLPSDKKIIGTAGALSAEKGIDVLYKAFLKLVETDSSLYMALAGIVDKNLPIPDHPNIIYLGKLTHLEIGKFFSTLDVGVIYLKNTPYGQASFPQKAYEMVACEIPVVATEVGDMSVLFSRENNQLYTADDSEDLVNALRSQIEKPSISNLEIPDWRSQAIQLNELYKKQLPRDLV